MPPAAVPPSSPASSAHVFAGRDRVLLYTRGMDVRPEEGVALALRSMRRAGAHAPPDLVMAALFHFLDETSFPPKLADAGGAPLVSAPPMNRRPMIAEDMHSFSLTALLRNWLRALFSGTREKGDRS